MKTWHNSKGGVGLLPAKKTDLVPGNAEPSGKIAPYMISTVGDIKISCFSSGNLCEFTGDFSDRTYFRGCFEILCIRTGGVTLTYGERSAALTEGAVAVIPPDLPYRIDGALENTERTSFFLSFERMKTAQTVKFSEFAYYSNLFGSITDIRVLSEPVILRLVERLGSLLREWSVGTDHIVQAYMSVLFIEISGALQPTGSRPFAELTVRDDRFLNKAHRRWVIERYISTCYMNDNPTEELMLQLFLSKRQTDRVVYQLMKESLASLITKQRIHVTKQLLASTRLTLQEISERVGYHSYSGFYNAVRKYCGMTPEQLLQNCRKGSVENG